MSDTYDDPLAGYGQWVPVTSSNLDAYKYDPQTRDLLIQFHGGRVYRYFRIPQWMVDGLASAGSKGEYFHKYIKGAPFERE
jgi:hypothetical protein